MAKRPPQRFVIRRLSRGTQTKLPWVLYDAERPAYVGRFATWNEARGAGPGTPFYGSLLAHVRANQDSHETGLPFRMPR